MVPASVVDLDYFVRIQFLYKSLDMDPDSGLYKFYTNFPHKNLPKKLPSNPNYSMDKNLHTIISTFS
jgi:hypothetical protein